MRVAHIITRLIIGGAQENTLFNCEDLCALHGDDVLLIAGPPEGPEGSLMRRAAEAAYRFEPVSELCRSVLPWNDWVAYRKIRRLLRDFRPDVVHTHSAKAGILGRLAARSLGVPAIVHGIHGTPFYPGQPAMQRWLIRTAERFAARRCDAFIAVADAMQDTFIREGIVPFAPQYRFMADVARLGVTRFGEFLEKPIVTIRSGMDVDPFLRCDEHRAAVRARYGFRDTDVVVGKIARLFRLKGHDELITAAATLAGRLRSESNDAPSVRFLLVGDGILHDELRSRIDSLGLGGMFTFAGLVPPEEIPAMISAMDIVVHTSLREGLARVLPQALIAGRPVVSYDIDGAREVCVTGKTGELIAPHDTDGVAAALERLARDPERRRRYGETGRKRFTAPFRHQRMTAETRRVYEKILRRKGVVKTVAELGITEERP